MDNWHSQPGIGVLDGRYLNTTGDSGSGDYRFSGYLRVGSTSEPSNTTAGDITGIRFFAGTNQTEFSIANTGATTITPTSNPLLTLSVAGTVATASANARGFKVSTTFSGAGGGPGGFELAPTFTPSSSTTEAYGFIAAPVSNPGTGVTISNHNAGFFRVDTGSDAGAVTTANALRIANASTGTLKPTTINGLKINNQGESGVGTAVGIDIDAFSGSTTMIGMKIAAPSGGTTNYALQLSDTGGTAAGGITFGTDVQLYRSAANTLKLDDSFEAANYIQAGNGVSFNESIASSVVAIGFAGSGTPTPRVLFANGTAAQNWQIDNSSGNFRWFLPGVEHMRLTSTHLYLPTKKLLVNGGTSATAIHDISMGGDSARSMGMERRSSANTAGQSLTLRSGGATSGATDKSSGDLILATGISTGSGTAQILLQTHTPSSGGGATSDNTAVTRLTISNSGLTFADAHDIIFNTTTGTKIGTSTSQKLAFYNSTPVVQATTIVDADGTLADITTKFNSLLAKLETYGLLAAA